MKDAAELAAIGAAAELADAAYERMRERGLGRAHRARGGRALPRGDGGPRRRGTRRSRRSSPRAPTARCRTPSRATWRSRADTLVVVDMGAQVDGYCSDCTRTFATGPARRRGARGLRAGAARPGGGARRGARRAPTCPRSTPWRATIIEAAGHGERFGHGLGHGVGLEVHEGPRLGQDRRGRARGRQRGDRRARRLPARRGRACGSRTWWSSPTAARGAHRLPQGPRDDRLMVLAGGRGLLPAPSSSRPPGFGFALVLSPALFAVLEPYEAVTTMLAAGPAAEPARAGRLGPRHVRSGAAGADAAGRPARAGAGRGGARAGSRSRRSRCWWGRRWCARRAGSCAAAARRAPAGRRRRGGAGAAASRAERSPPRSA